jgi:preprotein translocase subunit SecY
MLASVKNVFVKVADLRNKVLFTLLIVGIYQLGANVPVPGISYKQIQLLEQQVNASQNGILSFLNLFSGGALARFAIFGLGIMPYITSSIIIQLLVSVIPKLEQWRDQGNIGQRKLIQTTRYLTVGLAVLQSTGIAFIAHTGGGLLGNTPFDLIPDFTPGRVLMVILTLTAGTAFVMWLGELITQRGIGQGMSIIIFANVVAGIPEGAKSIFQTGGTFTSVVILLLVLALFTAVVAMELGQRRISVVYAKRVVGNRMYGGDSTYIPLKVNQAGVIPIIFASSVLYFPVLLASIIPWLGIRDFVNNNLTNPTSLYYLVIYGILIIAFTYFYVPVNFDPYQQADSIRKSGGYIPGIRPGTATQRYLSTILYRITLPGAVFLAVVALAPSVALSMAHIDTYPFLGTTILIAVGVALETLRQIDSQLMLRNYEGFLK